MAREKPLKARGLICPNGVYIAHMVVPADVRDVFGKTEFRRNLKTDNAAIAARESEKCRVEWKGWIADARAGRSPEVIQEKIDAWKRSLNRSAKETDDLSTLMYLRLAGSQSNGVGDVAKGLGLQDSELTRLAVAKGLADVEQARLFNRLLDDTLNRLNGLSTAAGDHLRQTFGEDLQRSAPPEPTGWSLDKFWRQVSANKTLTPSQASQANRRLICLKEFMGGDFDIGTLSKPKVVEFMNMVADYPARRTPELKKLKFGQAVRKARADGLAALELSTQKLWRNFFWSLFNKAVQQDIIAKNPFDAIQITGVQMITGEPLNRDQITRLFNAPRLAKSDDTYWITLSALFTGCRIDELATATRAEFIQIGDDWFFDLRKRTTLKGDPRRVKNPHAKRLVPLHRDLVALGFIEWLDGQPSDRPFQNQARTYGQTVAKVMKDTAIIKTTGKNNTFHGLRHTAKRVFRDEGMDEQISDLITGHDNGSVSRRYGFGANPETLAAAMNRVRFEGTPSPV